ncbi:DUF7134 domain-containing protein [Streptomyces sp. NPDC002143]
MINSMQRRLYEHPRTVDATVAAVLFACSFPGSVVALPGTELRVPWWPGVLLAGVSCTALLWRRSRPLTAVAVTVVCAMVIAALGYLLTILMLGPLMVALYSPAVRTDRKIANIYTFTCIALLVSTAVIDGPGDEPLSGPRRKAGERSGRLLPPGPDRGDPQVQAARSTTSGDPVIRRERRADISTCP